MHIGLCFIEKKTKINYLLIKLQRRLVVYSMHNFDKKLPKERDNTSVCEKLENGSRVQVGTSELFIWTKRQNQKKTYKTSEKLLKVSDFQTII